MAQYFKWFEQGSPQRPVLPGGVFDNHPEQPALLRGGFLQERKKFTPEFMNRLDKIVTFHPLGADQLRKILDIELNLVQQRIFNTSNDRAFVFTLADSSKNFLLEEGTDLKYGARHLKRAIERLLVHPMSNLIATDQVRGGDWIRVDYDDRARSLRFAKEAEGLPVQDMARIVDASAEIPPVTPSSGASAEPLRIQTARSAKRN